MIPYVLGLDIGSASIGWAVIEIDPDGNPESIKAAGSRIFEAGVEGDIEAGKDASRAATRRQARQARRQLARRAQRQARLFHLLQKLKLLPDGPAKESEQRHALLAKLDEELRDKFLTDGDHREQQLLPYLLRSKAVEVPLLPFELGRALYHLGQRRGYRANLQAEKEDDDERGKVKTGIAELDDERGDFTLGQNFATKRHYPLEVRIRKHWTARDQYVQEFERIWQRQAETNPILTDDAFKAVRKAIFHQRRLKSAKHLVGRCELTGNRRAPMALEEVQEFRILQAVNHLEIQYPDNRIERICSKERWPDRTKLLATLNDQGEMSFGKIRTLLKLPKGTKFNLENGGETRLIGNRTRSKLKEVFGDRWDKLPAEQRRSIILEITNYQKPEALIRRARKAWGLKLEDAERLNDVRLERDYARHSLSALLKLNELMRDGMAYSEARKDAFPESFQNTTAVDELPPVKVALPDLRNPAVTRALTEVRKIVNAIVRKFGKPKSIRLELARDLRRSRKDRKLMSERNRQQQKMRADAAGRILADGVVKEVRPWMIEKVLLADECNWQCPYTGKSISMQALIGSNPQFDIEHIFPRKYLDDSFANKTLCHHEENRNRKGNRLPFAAYGADKSRWSEILDRVRRFRSGFAIAKLHRFLTEEVADDFATRQLNDTRYNSTLAAEYLSKLYGGRWDADGTLRILTSSGGMTAIVRREWELNRILGPDGEKNRLDHRHHAVDAIAVASISTALVGKLSNAAQAAADHHSRRMFEHVEPPYPEFLADARRAVESIVVSHRADHRLGGPLHAETNYSKPIPGADGKPEHRVRKPLEKLSLPEVDRIVDDKIRAQVKEKLEAAKSKDPARFFAAPENRPHLVSTDGKIITPVHKVRIRVPDKPRPIGKAGRERYVASGKGTNHHTVVVAILDRSGNETKWEHHVVSRMEAHQRFARREPVIRKDWGPGKSFKFCLNPNDMIEADDEHGGRTIYRVASLAPREIQLWEHWRAGAEKSQRSAWTQIQTTDNLRKRNAIKIAIEPIGVRRATSE